MQDVLVEGHVGQESSKEVVVDQSGPDVGEPSWIRVCIEEDVAGDQLV